MPGKYSVDIEQLIDQHKLSPFQIFVAVLCACALLVDGFDTMAIGYVAPALIKAWGINRAAMTPAFAAGQIGLMIGSLVVGPLADRIGRRPVMILCSATFGVLSLLTMSVSSVPELVAVRFLTGLGLGGAMPNALALTSEYVPSRIRITAMMVMFCGFSIGAALGGLVVAKLIAVHGWQVVFLIGGILPLAFAVVLIFFLPESLRYLAVTGKHPKRLAKHVNRIVPDADSTCGDAIYVVAEKIVKGSVVRELFAGGRKRITLLLWTITFMNLLDLNLLSSWLPAMLRDGGLHIEMAALITIGYQAGGTVGTLTLGRFVDRFPPFLILVMTYVFAFLSIFFVGLVSGNTWLLGVLVFAAGFCVIGGTGACDALVATCYPTETRVTGLGWAIRVGRIGAILGPTIGGIALGMDWSTASFFAMGAVPMLGAAAAAGTIHMTRRKAAFREVTVLGS
ncbi:4-hydroxybenzoate transporter [Paraburkholderia caffeinilytica]|uniref:MFS transporter n=1 Tax=Paraburkholderia caffeinilytica TaxID=1761016 RepID=A0ABQ1LU80_9BURK|nr:MFS transporter [Paraburkholderia caffeinilytica]AXL53699.1 4-hydroxybenzoate transporter [Paraburkholderia caffeinilytica]GGC26801.1 MFS transporter [Paraburkholderia caffeinilytica]CAB3779874.1 4-hydroxybenzoate transporter PcaK [Paraburkholderia caffeinilytica]